MKKTTKSELTKELEKELTSADYQRPLNWSAMPTAYFVDVMAHVRKIRTVSLTTFGDFCEVFMKTYHWVECQAVFRFLHRRIL